MNRPLQRVLLVEDNEDDYLIVRDLLSDITDAKLEIEWVSTYEAACEAFNQGKHDVCLLDYRLDGHNGLELLEQLPSGDHLPVILLTGTEDHRVDMAATKAGAADYLVKGHINTPLLERSIRYAIQRRQSEAALLQAQRFAQSTVDALPDNIAVIDADGDIVAINAAWRNSVDEANAFVGATNGIGDNYLETCNSNVSAAAHEIARGIRAVMSGILEIFNFEYPQHSDVERWYEVRVTRFTSNGPLFVVVAHEDITSRKRAEVQLMASEANLASAQQIAHLGSWELDLLQMENLNVNPLRWSDEVFRIFGYEPGQIEVTNDNFFRAVHPDDCLNIKAAMAKAIQSGNAYRIDHRITLPDGSERIVREQAEGISDATGMLIKMVGTIQDITEQKQTEESLRQSSELLRAVADGATDAIFAKDIAGRYLMINSAGAQFFGKSMEEIVDKTDADLIPPEVAQEFRENDRFIINSGQVKTYEETGTINGITRTYLATKGPLYGPDGSVTGIVGISRDITERKQAEEALRASEERFQSIVTNVPGMVYQFVKQPDGSIEWPFVGQGCQNIFEIEPEALKLNPSWTLIKLLSNTNSELGHSISISSVVLLSSDWEGCLRMASGKNKWVQVAAHAQHLPNGGTLWNGLVMDITDRKKAEEERDSFFMMSLDMLGIAGLDGYFKRVNPAFSETLGYTEAELLAVPFLALVHPEDQVATQGAVESLAKGILVAGFENRYLCKDNSWRWLEWKSVAALGEGTIYAAARDVTERKDAELELLQMRDELERRVVERTEELEQTNAALQIQIAEREVAEAETRARARQQEAVAELGRRALTDIDIDTLLTGATALVVSTLDVEISSILELVPNSDTLTIRASTGWAKDMIGVRVDASARSQAGYALLHSSPTIVANLREETRFAPSTHLLDEGVVSGCTVIVGGYEQPFGTLGAHTTKQRRFTNEDINFLQAISNVIAAALEQRRVETSIRQLNAQLELTNEQLRIENLDRQTAIGTLRELAVVLEQAKEEAERARENAEIANRAKSEFLSRMSHELRTPLNSILGFGQILAMHYQGESAQQQDNIQQILKAGRHLLDLINEVLDIARIEAGHLTLSSEQVQIGALVQEAISLVHPLASARSIHLVNRISSEQATKYVLADHQRLKQVLLNFLSNAVKYNRHGGSVIVLCELKENPLNSTIGIGSQDTLRLQVKDTGTGLQPQDMARLFAPFERLGAAKTQIEGSGIGLSLCKQLIEAMKGQVGVESQPGLGSTFWLELPLIDLTSHAQEQTLIEPVEHNRSATPQTSNLRSSYTVLYIEDNLPNIHLIETILPNFGQEIRLLTALKGSEGIDMAASHQPDLILLDIDLPDMGGGIVQKHLKANPLTASIPIVVLSADATMSQSEQMLATGAVHYLTKPIDIRQFFKVLEQTLEQDQST